MFLLSVCMTVSLRWTREKSVMKEEVHFQIDALI